MFYLTTHSTHFIYGYLVSDIWLRTIIWLQCFTEQCTQHILFTVIWLRTMFYWTTHSTHFIYSYMASMFYWTMHSTHFIYSYMASNNVLLDNTLNTFYLQLYGFEQCFTEQHTQHILFTVIWLRTMWCNTEYTQPLLLKEGSVLFNDALNTFS